MEHRGIWLWRHCVSVFLNASTGKIRDEEKRAGPLYVSGMGAGRVITRDRERIETEIYPMD